jgi:predicted Zn-dependent protease
MIKRAFILVFAMALPAIAMAQSYSLAGANAYVARKDWNNLLAYTQAWTRANPNDPMAWYYLGETYGIGLNRPADAANAIRSAVTLKAQWPEAWHALAFTQIQSKQYQEAVSSARQAVTQAPDKPNYWNTLATAYSEMNNRQETLRTLQDEQQRMSRATFYDWYNLGNGYSNAGYYQEAVKAYAQAMRLSSNYGPAWNNLGVAEAALGQNANALADYQRASQLGNSNGAQNYSSLRAEIAAAQAAASQRSSGPRPGTPSCYASLSPACASDHSSLVYTRNHSDGTSPQ